MGGRKGADPFTIATLICFGLSLFSEILLKIPPVIFDEILYGEENHYNSGNNASPINWQN
jgi:hypothetical protein